EDLDLGGIHESGGTQDLLGVDHGPFHQRQQEGGQFAAALGEAVVDPGRDHRLGLPVHQPVALQGPQRLGEHLLTDALRAAAQLAPAQRLPGQRDQDEHAPLAGDVVQDHPALAPGRQHPVRKMLPQRPCYLVTNLHASTLPQSGYFPAGSNAGGYVIEYVIAARELVIWRTRPGAGRSYVGNVRSYDRRSLTCHTSSPALPATLAAS